MPTTSPFDNQRFILLETYRKNGTPVATPVGFVQEGSIMYVRTTCDSGKVKRIRRNSRVRVAPGTGSGRPLGDWVEATAALLTEAEAPEIRGKILAKYHLIWILIETVDGLRNRIRRRPQPEWVHLRIELDAPGSSFAPQDDHRAL